VKGVVDKLEAPHLKPSGIEQRLLSGVDSACFGLFTLTTWLKQASEASSEPQPTAQLDETVAT
jgi:hypothetical protein